MRFARVATIAGLTLAAATACTDAVAPRSAAPAPSRFAKVGGAADPSGKVTICHAAGQAGTTHFVAITVSWSASYAHIDEHGVPTAGHERDRYGVNGSCDLQAPFTKTLVDVMTVDANRVMITDPAWTGGSLVVIPQGQTRWLKYQINYTLPTGVLGTITDSQAAVCGTLTGSGYTCSFGAGWLPFDVSATGFVNVVIDITNVSACGDRLFTNTAHLTPSTGSPLTATATVTLRGTGTCPVMGT